MGISTFPSKKNIFFAGYLRLAMGIACVFLSMENLHQKMDDILGYTHDFGNLHFCGVKNREFKSNEHGYISGIQGSP